MSIEQQREYVETMRGMWQKTLRVCGADSNPEQQREYVETMRGMWLKTLRVCGADSNPEKAMLDVLVDEKIKLDKMEADHESD
jgi:uncharacterized protein